MAHAAFFEKIFTKPHLFKRITTFSIEEFHLLVEKLEPEWHDIERARLEARKERIHRVGQGRHYELDTFINLLLATTMYMRTSLGYELLGLLFHIDGTTVKRVVKRVTPLLQDRFIPITPLTKQKRRTNKLDDLLKEYPELADVIFDGTELPTNKPIRRESQQYSAKKKRHAKKVQIALDKKTKLIIGVSPPAKGKMHDKTQLEKTGWDAKLSQNVTRWADLAYLGMPHNTWRIPQRKPRMKALSRKQKRHNRQIAKERIIVEHSIRGIKIFRRVGETIRIKQDEFLFTILLASANLHNFKRLVRQGI